MRRELDIADAEAYTKIRAKYLRALENDEFGILPDQTLVKTFLRTYSEYLGLDAQLLIEEYRAQHEPREADAPAFSPRRAREPRRVRSGPPVGPGGRPCLALGGGPLTRGGSSLPTPTRGARPSPALPPRGCPAPSRSP